SSSWSWCSSRAPPRPSIATPGTGDGTAGPLAGTGSAADLHVVEDAEGVGDEDDGGVVGRDQVGHDPLVIDSAQPDAEAGLGLVGEPGLAQADDPLVPQAGAHRED